MIKKKVLLTGGSGFIGRHTLPFLMERGFEIYAISSRAIEAPAINWIKVDLLDFSKIGEILNLVRPTHLLHLAWFTEHGKFWHATENLNWVQASLHLIHQFYLNGGERVVCAGTCAEYEWNHSIYYENKTPYQPATLYGTSKRALYLILEKFSKQVGLSFGWGHIFYLFGQNEHPKRFFPSIIQALLNQIPLACSHGNQKRDFLYVKDVADAFATLLDSLVEGAVNIGSGKGISLKEIGQGVENILGSKEILRWGSLDPMPNDPPELIADVTRLNHELKWNQKYSLEAALQETVDWWKTCKNSR